MPFRLISIFLLACLPAFSAEPPRYLKEALKQFQPSVPPNWAYTVTTQRDADISVERFDPSRPEGQQWTLQQLNNRPATADEISRYVSYRVSVSRSSPASFTREDIDPASFQLMHEDENRAEFQGGFREDVKDALLHRLQLQITVSKSRAAVERFSLHLTEPYSPVLTVKMLDLHVETDLSAPTADRPALPTRVVSRFRGKIFFFKAIDEVVKTDYSDYSPVNPSPTTPQTAPAGHSDSK